MEPCWYRGQVRVITHVWKRRRYSHPYRVCVNKRHTTSGFVQFFDGFCDGFLTLKRCDG